MQARRIENRQLVYVLVLFLIVQFFGFLVVYASPFNKYSVAATFGASPQTYSSSFMAQNILYFAIAVAVIVLLMRLNRADVFFRVIEAIVVIIGTYFLSFIILLDFLHNAALAGEAALIPAICIMAFRYATKGHRNLITMISSMGYGIFIGMLFLPGLYANSPILGFLVIYGFMAAIAIYDYLAVFVLKFMIPMARQAAKMNLAFMIGSSSIEMIPKERLTKKEIEDFRKTEVSINNHEFKKLIGQGNIPAVSSAMLGNGDLMVPLMVTTSSFIAFGNAFISIMTVAGSMAGLVATLYMLKRYKVGMPAIPPLFAFISIFLFISFLFVKPEMPLIMTVFLSAALISISVMAITLRRQRETG